MTRMRQYAAASIVAALGAGLLGAAPASAEENSPQSPDRLVGEIPIDKPEDVKAVAPKASLKQGHTEKQTAEAIESVTGTNLVTQFESSEAADRSKPSISLADSSDQAFALNYGEGLSVEISYDADKSTGPAIGTNGTTVYQEASDSTDLAAQVSEDSSLSLLTVLNDETASSEQTYTLNLPAGAEAVPTERGGFEIVMKSEGVELNLGTIEAPWAEDANGEEVETYYEIDGDQLTQYIETNENTMFPVVADPKVTFGWGVYLNMWGREMKAVGVALGGISYSAYWGSCVYLDKIPHPAFRNVIRGVCAVVGVGTAKDFLKHMKKLIENDKWNSSSCYQIKIATNDRWKKVSKKNCR
ncbi:hypothetical protein [Salininema proteolyticum]|uniref:Uncharacterized protein n=1 Tax=Salininema proteolyticum TaxID=1607685 RepID=A0ABV8U005_9ACTN